MAEVESPKVERMMPASENPPGRQPAQTWAELKTIAQNGIRWRGVVAALCSPSNYET